MHKLLITLFSLLITTLVFSQREKNGDYTVAGLNEIVNTYTTLSASVNASNNSISVANNSLTGANFSGALEAGDLLLIYQVQGGKADASDYPTTAGWGDVVVQFSWFDPGVNNGVNNYIEFGEMINYKNVGIFEFVEVLSVSGTQNITLTCPLTKDFVAGIENNKTQVIRIPRFNNLAIPNSTSITTPSWNGSIGGVIAIEVNGTLNITGTGEISADSTGFRGGLPVNNGAAAGSAGSISNINDRGYLGSQSASEGSEKGEGITGGSIEYDVLHTRYGYGSLANGGGGGGYHNAGGGGGSNVGVGNFYGYGVVDQGPANAYNSAWNLEDPTMVANPSSGGGRGGYSHCEINNNPLTVGPHNAAWGSDYRRISGGVGGHALNYTSDRIFLGGGGGAGHGNDNFAGIGGAGGGAVFLNLYGNITGDGKITANGGNGESAEGNQPGTFSTSKTGDDGAGGAGGGGAIFIKNINSIPTTFNLEAKGGNGGDQILKRGGLNTSNQADGPGGGGAGGLISYSLGTPNENVTGGIAGVTNSTYVANFPVNGATGGAAGMASQSTTVFDIVLVDDTICEGQTTTLVANITGNFGTSPSLTWYDAAVGGSIVTFGTTYTTPALTTTTTYYVGTCPGTFRTPVTVVVSPQIIIVGTPPTISDETCAGNDGSITGLTASGGIGPLTFDWNGNSSISEDLNNAIGGTYTLTVTDIAGCSETAGPFTIVSSPGPIIDVSNMAITNESCIGNDGSITGITFTGGATPYTFQWNGNASTNTDLTGAISGNYTLIVTDNNGCAATVGPYSITANNSISIDETNISIISESCNGTDGSITGITVTGGTGTLTYSWSPSSATTLDLNSVSSGNYTLTVSDASGCSATSGPHTINQIGGPTSDDANILITNETCGLGNGSITGITTTGSGLTYVWSPSGGTAIDASNLSNGIYTLTITDGAGCSASAGPYTITNSAAPIVDISNIAIVNENCAGNDGSITGITFTGGATPFTFDWNGTATTSQDLNNATAGNYTLTITDNNGCTATAGPFNIAAAIPIVIDETNMVIQDASCNGNDGSITGINVSGGTGTLTYSWSTGGNAVDLLNINNGTFTLTVTDGLGCSETSGPHIVNQIPGPTVDAANVIVEDETCSLGNASITGITATGNGLTYAWSPSGGNALDANNLSGGTYNLLISDAFGCTVSAGPFTIINTPALIVDVSGVSVNPEDCIGNNGSINGIIVSGGTAPYNYNWGSTVTNSPNLSNVSGGTYTLIVIDANGCSSTVGPYTIPGLDIPDVMILTADQSINKGDSVQLQATVTPPTSNLFWSPADGLSCVNCDDPLASPSVSTWYVVTAISLDGCIESDSIFIAVENPCGNVKVPTVFSPNGDGLNDEFCVLGNCLQSMRLQIFNRWGEVIYETTEVTDCWNGTFRGKPAGTGVYVYKLRGVDNKGIVVELAGNVNLLR
ncbi:T9SS type B sorting domain-containing protein [Brumimicrobium glaciale]|uniref:T9SS type B sorting domain-containing protein n=1 Tax=Brumimicrobium glaciale TaxID=200475 RepID=A0A4Q4KKX9_9FLAO|nr:gliding motility-associated C-terminal domain-containing protein [Brumimicrobium glaciale]RYM33377.1 T9SS type B sorting domain-containing protein [Brumimicrobium glaciale]